MCILVNSFGVGVGPALSLAVLCSLISGHEVRQSVMVEEMNCSAHCGQEVERGTGRGQEEAPPTDLLLPARSHLPIVPS